MRKVFFVSVVLMMVGGTLCAQQGGLTPEEVDYLSAAQPPAPNTPLLDEGVAGSPEWYGTDDRFWIPGSAAANCTPVSSTETFSQSFGWYYGTSGVTQYWNCHIPAPSGTRLTQFEIEVDDDDASYDICAYLWKMDYYGSTTETIASGCTSGTPGGTYIYPNFDETLLNHNYHYMIRIVARGNSSLRFRAILYSAYRQISPAPGVATFPDVGTGFWAFQYIEALVDSGIIDGFPDGTFKPADPITRAQVAKMFAVALGVHWPN